MAALVRTEMLCKEYCIGSEIINAVNDVSVSIDAGEFVSVMGPSGSGKSTFMNLLGCLDSPTSGRYFLEEEDVFAQASGNLDSTRAGKIGFIFQNFSLLPRFSALENVELPLKYARYPRHERRDLAFRMLDSVGLGGRAQHMPTQLSGGQQQRVAIARALVNSPAIILADEPTGALDTKTTREIMQIFGQLNQAGITLILVTHELEIACFARRILRFLDGRIVEDSPVEQNVREQRIEVGPETHTSDG